MPMPVGRPAPSASRPAVPPRLLRPRLRGLLRSTYRFPTSHGLLTFEAILERCQREPLFESEFDCVVWYNTDRRQESYINSLFASHDVPCVHTLRSFEESLLASMVGDVKEVRVVSEECRNIVFLHLTKN